MRATLLRYGAFLLSVYLCVLIYSLPASFVQKHFVQTPPGVILQGVSGSIWSGHLDSLTVDGHVIENINWILSVSALLSGDVELDWSIVNATGELAGRAKVLDNSVQLSAIKGSLDMAAVSQQFAGQAFFATGVLLLDIEEYSFSAHSLNAARGTLTWQQANVLAPVAIELGGIETTLHEKDGELLVRFTDNGQAVDLSGEAQLSMQYRYRYQLRFGVRDTTATGVVDVFNLMGLPDEDGHVNLEGQGVVKL